MTGRPPYTGAAARASALDWPLAFFSFTTLLLVTQLATAAVALFLLAWILIAFKAREAAIEAVIRNAWLLLLPAFAVLSTMWSDSPELTFRAAVQCGVTTLIGIWAGTLLKPRLMVSSLLAALTFIVLLSLGVRTEAADVFTGEYALVGVFGSKNQLAFCAVIYLLCSITVIIDGGQPRLARLLGMAGLLLAPFVLFAAKSAGSLVASFPGLALLVITWRLATLPRAARATLITAGVLVTLLLVLGIATMVSSVGGFLDLLGKDSSLTGRTDLWEQALEQIWERPLFGSGFQAFWRLDNPQAQQLWLINHVPAGSGFNFHNLYLNLGVDLGLTGVFLVAVMLVRIVTRLVAAMLAAPVPVQFFAAGIFAYLLTMSMVEANFPYQFQLSTVLFNMVWCTLRPVMPARPAAPDAPAASRTPARPGNRLRR
jgi:exopolysaccharide production protein ExoQ